MEQIGFPETSARNYHHSLRNNPEERSSHLLPEWKPEITHLQALLIYLTGCTRPRVAVPQSHLVPSRPVPSRI
jgi:hypothetical protein